MMPFAQKIGSVQSHLASQQLDGWLIYDFRRQNDLGCNFLEIPLESMLTRRFFYWIPTQGIPMKIVHSIEKHHLDHLPGDKTCYHSWQELENTLSQVIGTTKRIAMEYSPRNAIPYVSKVDGGTLDLIRSLGIEVVSSADLLQYYTSVWNEKKWRSHLAAATVLDETVEKAWQYIANSLKNNQKLTEYDVQQFILQEFAKKHCIAEGAPICAINAHSSDPHYSPEAKGSAWIQPQDFILIDLWCKQDLPHAVYADICRVGVASEKPTPKQQQIFEIVKKARDAGTGLVKERFQQGIPLMGWEVDARCRQLIQDAGYGHHFIHRTGHNIDSKDHGSGANLDNLETQDRRQLLKGTCFSIEPGIYLPEEFGIRLEYDVYVDHEGGVHITGGIQESIKTLLDISA